jgi:hypothetical protein
VLVLATRLSRARFILQELKIRGKQSTMRVYETTRVDVVGPFVLLGMQSRRSARA